MTWCRSTLTVPFWRFVALSILFAGCAHTVVVEIPPRVDLRSYQTIGIIEFSSDSEEPLDQYATERFMAAVQHAQPSVRFLELGSREAVLQSVNRKQLDPDALKAIGKKHGVHSVFTGTYDISNVKPKVRLGEDLSSIKASAIVNLSLVSKHWDTVSGATLWTNSRSGGWSIADVAKKTGRSVSFSVSLPEDQYEPFIAKLVYAVTDDFQPHYEKRKVPKH